MLPQWVNDSVWGRGRLVWVGEGSTVFTVGTVYTQKGGCGYVAERAGDGGAPSLRGVGRD